MAIERKSDPNPAPSRVFKLNYFSSEQVHIETKLNGSESSESNSTNNKSLTLRRIRTEPV